MKRLIKVFKKQIEGITGYTRLKTVNAELKENISVKSNQISLLNKRLGLKNEELIRLNQSIIFMGAEQDKSDEQLSSLQEQNFILQDNYDRSEVERERISKYANDLMVRNSIIVQKLFLSMNANTFSVLAARQIGQKTFDVATWEVLFIDQGILETVVIERLLYEQLVDVMRLVETSQNVEEVLAKSLSQSISTVRGVQ